MKTITLSLFILLFLYCISPAKAQYQSLFGQNSTEWVIKWGNLFGVLQDTIYTTQDTFFIGKWWKEIVCTPDPGGTVWYPGGFLAEDTTTGEVWYKSKWDTLEVWTDTSVQLAFDFSLQVGDTFNIGNGPTGLHVVDSVYYENGQKIIRFDNYFTFIEGVGCNLGIIHRQNIGFMQEFDLICAYKDTVQTYLSMVYLSCDVFPDNASPIFVSPSHIVKLYPNPVIDILYIESTIETFHIEIYNNLGVLIFKTTTSAINMNLLPTGIYHVLIRNNQKIISKQSIYKL
jgi:hypothetical protein